MEFVVTITTLSFVVILQLIILVNQRRTGRKILELLKNRQKSEQPDRERFRDRTGSGSRQHRRNQQNSRSKSSSNQSTSTSSSVDNVEKSLRDINLKLKNAERDQEAARRRIQEKIGKESSKRRHSRGNRDENREHRRDRHNRGNWRNRSNQEKTSDRRNRPNENSSNENSVNSSSTGNDNSALPTATLPDLNPTDFDSDTTQHGRKFTVKRRILKDDASASSEPSLQDEQNAENQSNPPVSVAGMENQFEVSDEVEKSNQSDISFGRR